MRDAYHEALDAITDELVAMSRQVASMMQRASVALLEVDRERAEAVSEADENDDDRMDELHRAVLDALLADDHPGSVNEAVDVTLLNRYYERYADHAVSVARRVIYLVIGERAAS